MTPLPINTGTNGTPWYRHGVAPGWITLGAAILFVAVGALTEEVAPRSCRLDDTCGLEPFGTLSFGLLAAAIVAAFIFARAAAPIAIAFLLAFVAARFAEVEHAWWVDVAAACYVIATIFVTWPRHHAVRALTDQPVAETRAVPAIATSTLVRPGWLLGFAVSAAVAVAGVAGYIVGRGAPSATDLLLLVGIAGGVSFAMGWRAVDLSLKRRRFLARPQPRLRALALPLRFEVIVMSVHGGDQALVVPSSVWEEARLERLWADASPDGCAAFLYGKPASGRWAAVDIAGETVLGREPTRIEPRDDAVHTAAVLLRHLADAVPNADVADTIRRTADRYAPPSASRRPEESGAA